MIDEDRTMQLFEYTSDELSKGSNKPIIAVCEECGKYRVIEKAHYHDLCRSCAQIGRTDLAGRTGENSPHWKGGKLPKICEICGKEFSVKPYKVNMGHGRFCSRECQNKWRSEAFCGENSPCFGKNPSVEARQKQSATKQGIPYDEWELFATNSPYCPKFNNACRESNREKYDRCCFLSGMTETENGKKLSVHHIDMDKTQGCDGHTWKLVPLAAKWHGRAHTQTWVARIQYLLTHVWGTP